MRNLTLISDLNIKGVEVVIGKKVGATHSELVHIEFNPVSFLERFVKSSEFNPGDCIVIWCTFYSYALESADFIAPTNDATNQDRLRSNLRHLFVHLNHLKRNGLNILFICTNNINLIAQQKYHPDYIPLSRNWEYLVFEELQQNGISVAYESDLDYIDKVSLRRWYTLKNPYALSFLKEFSTLIFYKLRSAEVPLKVIAVDLDNTLWGGIVGEDSKKKKKIGGIDQTGELFWDIQQSLLRVKKRGILLGILSKNNLQDVSEAFEQLEMPLSLADFSFVICNWDEKHKNIELAAEKLNLSLSSFAFIDDSALEREKMKSFHPEVLLVTPPEELFLWPYHIEWATAQLNKTTAEDSLRSVHYQLEEKRKNLLNERSLSFGLSDPALICQFLDVKVSEVKFDPSRALQLFKRTNQFNLASRRLEVDQIEKLNQESDLFAMYSISDKYGNYGVSSLLALTINGTEAIVTDFILSCRVLGRNVEYLILDGIKSYCGQRGCTSLSFRYQETTKNAPVRKFLAENGLLGTSLRIP